MDKNLRAMLDHLFMPRKLSLDLSDLAETDLMDSFALFLSHDEKWKALYPMVSLMSSFNGTPPTVEQLLTIFKQDIFCIAVPLLKRKAVLLFNGARSQELNTLADKKTILISAIDVLPHANSIHSFSEDKEPYPSDCRMAVPRSTILVSLEQIQSKVFLEQLVELGKEWTFPGREVTTRKAGQEVTETRKPANPTYVFDWLLATLIEELPPSNPNQTHAVVVKRIRLESVRKNLQEKPWNRSSLWIAMKSSLHLSMVQLTAKSTGYKSLMARFQATMVLQAFREHQANGLYDFAEIKEMLSYLSRKVEKLQQHHPEASQAIDEVCVTCESVDKKLKDEWSQYLETQHTNSHINMKELEEMSFSSDMSNPLTSARPTLEAALGTDTLLQRMRTSTQRPPLPAVPVHVTFSNVRTADPSTMFNQLIEAIEKSSAQKNVLELESALQSTEYFIRTLWSNRDSCHANVEAIVKAGYNLLKTYQKHSSERYAGEAIRSGKRIFYSFTLVASIDAVCVRWDPLKLLGQHQFWAVDRKELEELLKMDKPDLTLLEEIHDYCGKRTIGLKPGFVDLSSAGFPYRYSLKDQSMIKYLNDYALEVERLRQEKLVELNTVRDKHEILRLQRDGLNCECVTFSTCQKCIYSAEMQVLENSVVPYEKRLPEDDVLRSCVVFHHKIPKILQYYRDSCALLIGLFIENHREWKPVKDSSYQWPETPFNMRIAIGSTDKSFLNTHYKKPNILTED